MSDRISALRQERGWSQTELAKRAGVTRQLVSALESCRHVPNVTAALGLAKALSTTVEELFAAPANPPETILGAPLATGTPVTTARVGEQLVALPAVRRQVESWTSVDSVIEVGGVEQLPGRRPADLLIAGCDPLIGVLAELASSSQHQIATTHASTGQAIAALSAGRVHAVVVHARAGELPEPSVDVMRWRLANWQVGLAAAGSAPSVEHLVDQRAVVVQRDSGASSQQALDRALEAAGGTHLPGPVGSGHLDIAQQLSHGVGAAGVVMEPAALAFDLSFTALEEHSVELWLATEWLGLPAVNALLNTLQSQALLAQTRLLPGYDIEPLGKTITIN
ncbi:MAG: substrate-binding domain-containing protein [Marmoricola sp.]|jgi:DNA-binding XRE family transcriptional regulator/molybdate-binding protein